MSDRVTIANMPESGSKEAIALRLTELALRMGIETVSNRKDLIDLYVDCYNATLRQKL